MRKKIIYILVAVILLGTAWYFGQKIFAKVYTQRFYKSLNSATNDEDYYLKLEKNCKLENFCLQSVKTMQVGGYKLAQDDSCGENFDRMSLPVKGSYTWCEPRVWQTYRNEKLGFEFQYFTRVFWEDEDGVVISLIDHTGGDFSVTVIDNPESKKLDEFVSQRKLGPMVLLSGESGFTDMPFNRSNITIDGVESVKLSSDIDRNNGDGYEFYENVYIPRNDKIIQISFEANTTSKRDIEEAKKILEKIISTFKFIDNSTADWQTYRNEKYGYQINYPENVGCVEDDYNPADEITCLGSTEDRMYVAIKPITLIPGQNKIIFNPVIGVGGTEIDLVIKDNDLLGSIDLSMRDAKTLATKYKFLENTKPLDVKDSISISGVDKINGFLVNTTAKTKFGGSLEGYTHEYEKSWFFVKGNVLYQLYSHYDDILLGPRATEDNFIKRVNDLKQMEKILSTMTFSE